MSIEPYERQEMDNASTSLKSPPTTSLDVFSSGPTQSSQKLRLSCDFCAAAKIKCDKNRPSCGRCIAGKTECVYGISRKYAKSRQREQTRRRSRTYPFKTPLRREPVPYLKICPEGNSQSSILDELFCQDTIEATTPDQTAKRISWDQQTVSPLSSFDQTPPAEDMHLFNTSFKFDPRNDTEASSLASPSMPNFADFEESQMLNMSFEMNPKSMYRSAAQNRCLDGAESCHTLLYSTLDCLHPRLSSMTIDTEQPPSPDNYFSTPLDQSSESITKSFDQVLCTNKASLRNVMRILACSCSGESHVAMLSASILSKAFKWYRIAREVSPSPFSKGCPPISPTGPESSPRYSVFSLPITVGDFELDEETQCTMRQQLLLAELQKAEEVVETLAMRQVNGEENLGADTETRVGELYTMLGSWLRAELGRTVRDVRSGGLGRRKASEGPVWR